MPCQEATKSHNGGVGRGRCPSSCGREKGGVTGQRGKGIPNFPGRLAGFAREPRARIHSHLLGWAHLSALASLRSSGRRLAW